MPGREDQIFINKYGQLAYDEFMELRRKWSKAIRDGRPMRMYPVETKKLFSKHGIAVAGFNGAEIQVVLELRMRVIAGRRYGALSERQKADLVKTGDIRMCMKEDIIRGLQPGHYPGKMRDGKIVAPAGSSG